MRISGYLQVTNICKHDIESSAARLGKPDVLSTVRVRIFETEPSQILRPGDVTDLQFELWVHPPIREKDQVFKGDVAIRDKFGNEHWLYGIAFVYLRLNPAGGFLSSPHA